MTRDGKPGGYLVLLWAGLMAGCEPGGKSGGDCASVAGTWQLDETTDASACGGGTKQRETTWVISQQGCSLTIAADKSSFQAKASEAGILLGGTHDQDEGQVSIPEQQLPVGDGSLSGAYTWSYSAPGVSCQGSTKVSGKRVSTSTGGSGGSSGGSGGSSGGQGALGADENALVGTWFRGLGYGGKEYFYVFKTGRDGCKWEEPPESGSREDKATFVSWRLVALPPAGDGRFDVLVKTTGEEYSAGVFDRPKLRFYQGGYSNLAMSLVEGGKTCE